LAEKVGGYEYFKGAEFEYSSTWGQFDTNNIIFRNVEILGKKKKNQKFSSEKHIKNLVEH